MNKFRDPIIKKVVDKFVERSNTGYKKYGVTLHDDEPNLHKWLNHIQEELMDAINYIEKLKMETTDALEEKIYKDYKDDDDERLSIHSNPEMWTQDHS